MRTRLAAMLTLVAFALLMIPAVGLAASAWDGSRATIRSGTGWTNKASITLDFFGTVTYVMQHPGDAGTLAVFLGGDVVSPKPIPFDDGGGSAGYQNGVNVWTAWCSGDADVPLKPGDGEKELALQYALDRVSGRYWSPAFGGTVVLDTHGPTTIAPYALSARKGGYATVRYQVEDSLSPTATVSMRVTNAKGKTVGTVDIGEQETDKLLTYLWKCSIGKGKYTYRILATDLAGNKASKAAKNTLTVK